MCRRNIDILTGYVHKKCLNILETCGNKPDGDPHYDQVQRNSQTQGATLNLYAIQRRTLGLRIPLYLIIMWVPIGFVSAGLQYVQTLFMNIASKDVYISPTHIDEEEDDVSMQFEL